MQTEPTAPSDPVCKRRRLNFYGWTVEICWPPDLDLAGFDKEFQHFEATVNSTPPDLSIVLRREKPQVQHYSFLRPRFATPRNVCYEQDGQRLVNYHNQALLLETPTVRRIEIVSEEAALLESILYTVLIAKSGAHFDRLGRFRVHALSFSVDDRGYMILLPMGGGKSTLLLNLLRHPGISLISEDTPLLDRRGRLWPFPVKIGVLPGKVPEEVPPSMVSRIRHLEGTEKEVIDLAYLGSRIAQAPIPVAAVFVGVRYLGDGTGFSELSFVRALRVAVRDCVIGVGVYQGLEFILSRSNWELVQKVGLGLRRLAVCAQVLRRTPAYEFQMGTDAAANAAALLRFLETHPVSLPHGE